MVTQLLGSCSSGNRAKMEGMCELLHTGDVFWPSSGGPPREGPMVRIRLVSGEAELDVAWLHERRHQVTKSGGMLSLCGCKARHPSVAASAIATIDRSEFLMTSGSFREERSKGLLCHLLRRNTHKTSELL